MNEVKSSLGNVKISQGTSFHSEGRASVRETESGVDEEKNQKKTAKFFDFIISFSLAAIFFGLPLFFTGLTLQGIAFDKQVFFYALILIGLVAWVSRGVIVGELKIRRTPLDIPIIAFWLIYLLTTIFSVDRWHSFWGFFGDPSRGFLSATAILVAYYLIFSNFTQKRFKMMLAASVVSAAIVSLWSLLAVLGVKFLPDKIFQLAPLSLVGSVSGLGVFLSFMLPISITALFQIQKSEKMKPVWKKIFTFGILASLLVYIVDILLLFAFIPWPALLIGLGLFLIFILSRVIRPSENWTWLPMVAFVAAFAILMIGNNRLARINLPVEVTPNYQMSWDVAWQSAKNNFILGSGPATYGYDFSLHHSKDFNLNALYNLRFYQGTGLFFEALPTVGALGTIALILLALSFISVVIYLLTKEKEKNKIYSLGYVTSALILLGASFTGRAEGAVVIMAGLFGALALALLLWESGSEEKNISLSLKASPKYALALAFIFIVVSAGVVFLYVFLGKILVADVYAGKKAVGNQATEEDINSGLGKAIQLYPQEGRYYSQASQNYMILANSEILKGEKERDLLKVQNNLNVSILLAKRGSELMKNDVLAVENLALIYENASLYVKDSLDLARATYEQAQKLEPHNPDYFIKLGQIKIAAASGKEEKERNPIIEEAKGFFNQAKDEKNNYAPAYYNLSLAEEALGGVDSSINDMGKAFSLDRSNINYAFNLARLYETRGKGDDDKIAEDLFKQILGVNDKEINTHFSLGLLYEKTGRKSEAVSEYKKVIDLLPASQQNEPAGGTEGSGSAKDKIEKMISNIGNGISNQTVNAPTEDQPVIQDQQ